MEKLAVVTIIIGDRHKKISELTAPSQKDYAKKIGADFIVYDGNCFNIFTFDGLENTKKPFENVAESLSKNLSAPSAGSHNKFNLVELLRIYDRVLYLDIDIVIRKDAKSLFDIVPKGFVGMFEESVYLKDRKNLLLMASKALGATGFSHVNKYYNGGVILFSRGNEKLFEIPNRPYDDGFYEQTVFNWNIFKNKIPIFEISYKFNRMTFVDMFVKESRHDSYFIHYAGSWMLLGEGHSKNPERLLGIIRSDIELWEASHPEYNHKKVFLGSQDVFWKKALP